MSFQEDAILNLVTQSMQGLQVREATQAIERAQHQQGFALGLLSLVAKKNVDQQIRQQSGLILKTMIGNCWDENVIHQEEKQRIRNLLLARELISDESSKIRLTVAAIVGAITFCEQDAEKWPELMQNLGQSVNDGMSSGNFHMVDGAVSMMQAYLENAKEEVLCHFSRDLFAVLVNIVKQEQQDLLPIKLKCIKIFDHVIEQIIILSGTREHLIFELVIPFLTTWCDLFNWICSVHHVAMFSLQNEVAIVLHKLIGSEFSGIKPLMKFFVENERLAGILKHLWSSVEFGMNVRSEMVVWSDQRISTPTQLRQIESVELFLSNSFLFLEGIIMHPRSTIKNMMADKLDVLSFMMVNLLMLSHDEVGKFEFDPNDFIVGEDEDAQLDNLRASIRSVISHMLDVFPKRGFHALLSSASSHLDSSVKKSKGEGSFSPHEIAQAWREREAAILAFEFIGDKIYEGVSELNGFNPVDFVSNILGPHFEALLSPAQDGNTVARIFLGCRSLWCCSHFASTLPPALRSHFLTNVITSCLASEQPIQIRLAAVKSFDGIARRGTTDDMNGCVNGIIPLLVSLIENNHAQADAMYMVIDAIHSCVKIGGPFISEICDQMVSFLLHIWKKNIEDDEVSSRVCEIICTMCKYPCVTQVRSKCFPVCMDILNECSRSNNLTVGSDVVLVLQVLVDPFSLSNPESSSSSILINDDVKRQIQDVPREVFGNVCPNILELLLGLDTSSCNSQDEYAMEMLRFIATCIDFVCCVMHVNPKMFVEANCVDSCVNLIGKCLSPQENDVLCDLGCVLYGALSVDCGQAIETRNQAILLAALQRLLIVKQKKSDGMNLILSQRLLMMVLRLIGKHGMAILQFCCQANDGMLSVPMETGEMVRTNTIQFLCNTWMECHPEFYFDYDAKISLAALMKLLQESFEDEGGWRVMNEMSVKGYEIIDLSGPRRTRSRGPIEKRFTEMKLAVKCMSLMIDNVVEKMNERETSGDESGDEDSDDDDDVTVMGHTTRGTNVNVSFGRNAENGGCRVDISDYVRHLRISRWDSLNNVDLVEMVVTFLKSLRSAGGEKFERLAVQLNGDDQRNLLKIVS